MKTFLVFKDFVQKVEINCTDIKCPSDMYVSYRDYEFRISKECKLSAADILRHVCRLQGERIPYNIYIPLKDKIDSLLSKTRNNYWTYNHIDTSIKSYKTSDKFDIDKIIVSGPATIVFWTDGTKSVVKCQYEDDERFDLEKAIAMCFARKALGNENKYHKHIRKAVKMAEDYIEEHTEKHRYERVDTESGMGKRY